jgi:hypothetical protein
MSGSNTGTRINSQKRKARREANEKIQYLLGAEEHLVQTIFTRAPLPKVLNGICSTLDCQIGGVVSLISLSAIDKCDSATISLNAALFGLFIFHSGRVLAENNKQLGCLKMYTSVPRMPTAKECQLIERAKCVAAIAIKLENETKQ